MQHHHSIKFRTTVQFVFACLLGLPGPAQALEESFDWGEGVPGRETLSAGTRISELPLPDMPGKWDGSLGGGLSPVLSGQAGLGNGFLDLSLRAGQQRNSAFGSDIGLTGEAFTVETTVRLAGTDNNIAHGLHLGVHRRNPAKNLLPNMEASRIVLHATGAGDLTLVVAGARGTVRERGVVPYRSGEELYLRFGYDPAKAVVFARATSGGQRTILEVPLPELPDIGRFSVNGIGMETLAMERLVLRGLQPQADPNSIAAADFADAQADSYLRVTYPYRTVEDTELMLEVFFPRGVPREPLPAVLFFHGGGWKGGQRTQFYDQCRYLAEHGIIGITADYRTERSHGVEPIACVRDAKEAMRWVRAHADGLGIDPERLAAGGGSAGGHLAMALVLSPGIDVSNPQYDVSTTPAALVLFNPVIDTGPEGFGYDRVAGYWREFSPRHNLREGLPPMQILIGTEDQIAPPEVVNAFAKETRKLDNTVDVVFFPGEKHSFFNKGNSPEAHRKTLVEMLRFLHETGIAGDPKR